MIDPATGNLLDLKVMAHKIHMGSSLPSVIAGTPYQIIGFQNSVNDFSKVVDPAMAQRCTVCHDQTTGAAQATAYLTQPTASHLRILPRQRQLRDRRESPRRRAAERQPVLDVPCSAGRNRFRRFHRGGARGSGRLFAAFGTQSHHRERCERNGRQRADGDFHVDEQRGQRGSDLGTRFDIADHGGSDHRLWLHQFRQQCHDARAM